MAQELRIFALLITMFAMSVIQVSAQQMRNGLPPVTTDSFVTEAGAMKELIYGDESQVGSGVWSKDKNGSLPPFMNFVQEHRINAGIFDRRDAGLTTGHASWLPDAWGRDEFTYPGCESSFSGPKEYGQAPLYPPTVPTIKPTDPRIEQPSPPKQVLRTLPWNNPQVNSGNVPANRAPQLLNASLSSSGF